MRSGDFSVRMTGDHLASRERSPTPSMKSSPPISGWRSSWSASASRRTRGKNPAARQVRSRQRLLGRHGGSVNTLIDDLLWPTREVNASRRRRRAGRLLQLIQLDVDGRPLGGRIFAIGQHRQHDDQAAQRVHLRSDARRARSGHRRQLGGQAASAAVTGVWKDLTESVNSMANNLTARCVTSPR